MNADESAVCVHLRLSAVHNMQIPENIWPSTYFILCTFHFSNHTICIYRKSSGQVKSKMKTDDNKPGLQTRPAEYNLAKPVSN